MATSHVCSALPRMVLAGFLLLAGWTLQAAAATYYASPSGSGSCASATSPTTPTDFITGVNTCLPLAQGNVLQLRGNAGPYTTYYNNGDSSPNINWPRGTGWTAGNYFTVQGYPGDAKPRFTQPFDFHRRNALNGQFPQYIWLDNVEVDRGFMSDSHTVGGPQGLYFTMSHLKVTNSLFHNLGGVGISGGADDADLANSGADFIFDHNEVKDVHGSFDGNLVWSQPGCGCVPAGSFCGCSTGGYCMYISPNTSKITNNLLHDCTAFAIHFYHGGPNSAIAIHDNVISGNTMYNLATNDQHRGTSNSAVIDYGHNDLFMNNIIYNVNVPAITGCAAGITFDGDNNLVYNNTIADSPNCIGVYFEHGAGTVARGNIVFNVGTPTASSGSPGGDGSGTFTNNFTSNPSFVGTGNYHIASGSNARASVGGGCPNFFTAGVTVDMDNEARPSSGNFDCGADQVVAATPPVTTSQLEFGIQPSDSLTNATLVPLPTVRVETSNGSLVTTATDSITLSLVSTQIPQTNLAFVSADSVNAGWPGSNAIDGNTSTAWHTNFTGSSPGHPHNIVLNFPSTTVNGLVYTPRLGPDVSGQIAGYNIYVSTDCSTWGTAVGTGTFGRQAGGKRYGVTTTPKVGNCLKFESTSNINSDPYASAAEINVLQAASVVPTGALTQAASAGIATFTTAIPTAGVWYVLKATASGLTPQLSLPFTITDPSGGGGGNTDPAVLLRYVPGR